MSNCLFCRIVAGEIPADVVHQTPTTLAFRDISPQAPTHVLVVPRAHHPDADDVIAAAVDVAQAEGLTEAGYRLVTNTGDAAGQSVHHLHVHVLGGRDLQWPPG